MDKQCCLCRRPLDPSEYYPSAKYRDGLCPRCVTCDRAAVSVSYRKTRTAAIEHLGGRCQQCSYSVDVHALTFDHVLGDGAYQRRSGNRSHVLHAAILVDKAGLFQLLCSNCNSIKRIAESEQGSRVYKKMTYKGPLINKWCPRCKATKSVSEFCCNSARSDGLSSYCARCRVESESVKYQELRLRVIEYLGGSCKECGYMADDRALVVDHVNGGGVAERKAGKVGSIALNSVLHRSNTGKYQLLCANCNAIKKFAAGETGSRVYTRNIPTERIVRPNARWSPEARAVQSERTRRMWQHPETRARLCKARSEVMKRRWASGEVPSRRRTFAWSVEIP